MICLTPDRPKDLVRGRILIHERVKGEQLREIGGTSNIARQSVDTETNGDRNNHNSI